MEGLCFAYYCSGHGYGHATRVSAFAGHLLRLEPRHTVHIVSSAPEHIFHDSVKLGALYRHADIDPVIVQPLAYRIDRKRSVEVLSRFLREKEAKMAQEKIWLSEIGADCVLSDAAFLACLVANAAGLPSVLITNFTFDAVYSYLSTSFTDHAGPSGGNLPPTGDLCLNLIEEIVPDYPVPYEDIVYLVQQIYDGYRCADLLVLLPGNIPIPSFCSDIDLPSHLWTDQRSNQLLLHVTQHLLEDPASCKLHHAVPFKLPAQVGSSVCKPLSRSVLQAPLIVRDITQSPSVYTPEGRSRLLTSIGIPPDLHEPDRTKILVVSFGGQVFHKPSSNRSTPGEANIQQRELMLKTVPVPSPPASPRLATESHIFIPGAPPASKSPSPPLPASRTFQTVSTLTAKSSSHVHANEDHADPRVTNGNCTVLVAENEPRLLPDDSWIAIVCGVSKEQWDAEDDGDGDLPEQFFVAPKDVYMPDLTAVGDVLLGKLGYGTTSECINSCTPFVYVSRPLFVEEHGLRLLLERDGVGVELSRPAYEAGDWSNAVEKAWLLGREAKSKHRKRCATGIGLEQRRKEGQDLARRVVDWVKLWKSSSALQKTNGGQQV